MKNSIFSIIIIALVVCGCMNNITVENSNCLIIPKPVSYQVSDGSFLFDERSIITVEEDIIDNKIGTDLLKNWITDLSDLNPSILYESKQGKNCIFLSVKANNRQIGEEGYILNISKERIDLLANTPKGLFYGIQSLMQQVEGNVYLKDSINRKQLKFRCAKILDYP